MKSPFLYITAVLFLFGTAGARAQNAHELQEAVDSTIHEKQSSRMVIPILFYSPETRLGGGAAGGFFFKLPGNRQSKRSSRVTGSIVYTANKQASIQVAPSLYMKNDAIQVIGEADYVRFPSQFYGIGNDTPDEAEEEFTLSNALLITDALFRVRPRTWVGPSILVSHLDLVETEPGGLLETGSVEGSRGGFISSAGFVTLIDRRDNENYPYHGQYVRLRARWAGKALGSEYEFGSYEADVRQFVRLTRSGVLALQGFASWSPGEVPFTLMSKVGGPFMMRGYYEGRYRDQSMVMGQAEYRTGVWRRLGLAVFGAAGQVAHSPEAWSVDDLKLTYGAGLRFNLIPKERINLRIDYGMGPGTSGLYFSAGEAF